MARRDVPVRSDAPAVAELAAGGLVRRIDTDEVLALHVRSEDRWGFPKGHVEAGESIEVAARREIREETGISNLDFGRYLGDVHYAFFNAHRNRNVFKTVVYWEVRTPEPELHLEPIFDRSIWGSPESLIEVMTYETDRELLRRLSAGGSPSAIPRS